MTILRTIYHLARADFLERIRRYSFLVMLGLIIFLAYSYVPARDAEYITLTVDGVRGLYNSAWVGSLVAILAGITMPGVGFYLVKNAITRDMQTGVGQIMATTPLTRPVYTLGKWLSNFAVLGLMVGVTALATVVLQLSLGEDVHLDLPALLSPILWIVLPTMALVAGLAVLFETITWLRGGFGNVIYFFICTAITMASFLPVMINVKSTKPEPSPMDVFGIKLPLSSMLHATMEEFPDVDQGNNSIGPVPVSLAGPLQTFSWDGIQWTLPMIADRLFWIAPAITIALLAALFFNRFDPAREGRRRIKKGKKGRIDAEAITPGLTPIQLGDVKVSTTLRLTALASTQKQFNFGRILLAEVRMLTKGYPWWWYLVAMTLVVAGALLPTNIAWRYLLAFTWLWPILIWSALGTREVRNNAQGLVFSNSRPIAHQLPATWLAGVLMTALTGSGVAFNLLHAGELVGLTAWTVAVFFIPSLALALAVWSGDSKLFEVIYLSMWYVGPVNHIFPQLDFMGTSSQAIATRMPMIYLITTLALLIAAAAGRHWQLRG